MNSAHDVSIIIVTWNVRQCIGACLQSLPKALGSLTGEIFVVDNGSTDNTVATVEQLKSDLPHLHLIMARINLGFARANNLAIKQASGTYVLLLNPDTELKPGVVEKMFVCAKKNNAAIVGAHHLNPDGSLQPSVRRLPTFSALAIISLKLHRLWPRLRVLQRYYASDFDYEKTQTAEQVAGSCFLISREAINRIGLLDEQFHVWFEEVDWCKRARNSGLKVWYCAEAQLIHHGAKSFSQLSPVQRQRQFNRSMRYYFFKHYGFWPYLGLWALHPKSLAIAWLSGFHSPRKK